MAGRKPLPVGQWGSIAYKKQPNSKWRASALFRDFDGRTRTVERRHTTKSGADAALKACLLHHRAPASGEITPDTRIGHLAKVWLTDELPHDKSKSKQTAQKYAGIVNAVIIPRLGSLSVRELIVPIISRTVRAIALDQPTNARHTHIVLKQMLQLAVEHGAIPVNPVMSVKCPRGESKAPRAADLEDLELVRQGIASLEANNTLGPKRSVQNLADVFDFMLATGCRVNEALAVRWQDLDLTANPATVSVNGTLVRLKGEGIHRQAWTKSEAGMRVVTLPQFAVDMLKRRLSTFPANDLDAVFATGKGTWISANNIRTQWRAARKTVGLAWVVPHTFRKTVATLIEREVNEAAAASQLGHSSVAVTRGAYIEKRAKRADRTAVLEKLAPRRPVTSGMAVED